ncbi:MAG TPA: glucose-1-phosphate cytidylyltransferase [Nitrospira sp.]|nr:glucose-1-phosphate cytidylyltransferase [Nitrospira sp.]
MKVVLFCGGFGTRLREYSESIPKPMVEIGYRPILWHLMKYYAYHGHKEFILCLGYKADVVKKYFLHYDECISNDFVLANGGQSVELLSSDISDWKITFADTGLNSNIGQRLRAVEKHVGDDEMFLANYADGLTDLNLPRYIDEFVKKDKVVSFLSVKPTQSFHVVVLRNGDEVAGIQHIGESDTWINGGYFILRKEIFSYIKDGEELVNEPFRRLIEKNQLMTVRHKGFWVAMDTFKDKQYLDDLFSKDKAPWQVWKTDPSSIPWTPDYATAALASNSAGD